MAFEAEKELEKISCRLAVLCEEKALLDNEIAGMRRELPLAAARDRSIDPDILEQELLMALGKTGEEAKTDRDFRKLEKDSAADSALEALKAKLKGQ
jgi:hypothetical protein